MTLCWGDSSADRVAPPIHFFSECLFCFSGSLPVSSISHGQHCFDGSAGSGHLCYGPLPRLSVVGMLPCHRDPFVCCVTFVYGRVLCSPIDELLTCSINMAEDVITFCRLCCWLNGCFRRDVSISVMAFSLHTGGHLFCCVVT